MSEPSLTPFEASLLSERFPDPAERAEAEARLAAGEPMGYVLGEWYFCHETYRLNRDCLIPRPDTEHAVTALCGLLPENGRFADLGTGSGCIAISTLCMRPDVTALAMDISSAAVSMASENAGANGVADRLTVRCGDMTAPDCLGAERFDVIVSNPPYIRTDVIETLSEQVRREPRRALDGGPDGLRFYRHLLGSLRKNLKENGAFVFEIGYDQADDLRRLCRDFGYPPCRVIRDFGGNDRIVIVTPQAPIET